MATLYSTEYTEINAGTRNNPSKGGPVQYMHANFTGAVTTSDSVKMLKIPAGTRIHPMSYVMWSAHNSSTTMDVGYSAYTNMSDSSAVSADDDAFVAAQDTTSVGQSLFGAEAMIDGGYVFTGNSDLTFNVNAGSLASDDTVDLHIYYTMGG